MKKIACFSLILVLFVSACGVAKSESTMNVEMPAAVMDWGGNDAAVSSYDFVEESAAESYLETDEAGGQERMVIQTATMRVSVADTVEAMNATTALAKSMGGYVVSSDRYSDTTYNKVTYTRTSITIRVPAAKLEEAMQKIREMSADGKNGGVLSESLSGEDVTSDFVDSSSRLRNLKAAEEQLVRLMENTDDLDATMSVSVN